MTPLESPRGAARPDEVRRFVVENQPVRGHWVRLGPAWRELRTHTNYPVAVRQLLGEAVSASVLLAATLKFEGNLTLQFQGTGTIRLLVAQCTHDFRVRAVARYDEEKLPSSGNGATQTPFRQLVGEGGRLVVTIEASERESRYQGIVPLTGESLAECLETYFASSEQLPTRVRLASDDELTAGLLVQKLPAEERGADEHTPALAAWSSAQRSVESLPLGELLEAPVEELLVRRFGQQDLRLFKGSPVQFACRCSVARVAALLRSLGIDELREVVREQGAVTVTCEFCQRPYRFDAIDVEQLFSVTSETDKPPSIH